MTSLMPAFHVLWSLEHCIPCLLSYHPYSLANYIRNSQPIAMAPLELTQDQEYSKERIKEYYDNVLFNPLADADH